MNIDTKSRARVRVADKAIWVGRPLVRATDTRVVGQAVHVRAIVLQCAVAEADGGGGLRWLELMLEAVCMPVWAPCQALMWVVVLHC
jgi:hypothetical protein